MTGQSISRTIQRPDQGNSQGPWGETTGKKCWALPDPRRGGSFHFQKAGGGNMQQGSSKYAIECNADFNSSVVLNSLTPSTAAKSHLLEDPSHFELRKTFLTTCECDSIV
eukprot:EG_transcript_39308